MLKVWDATVHNQVRVPSLCALPPPPPYQFVTSGCKKLTESVPEREWQENYLSTGPKKPADDYVVVVVFVFFFGGGGWNTDHALCMVFEHYITWSCYQLRD